MNKWDRLPRITEDEFVAHLENENFLDRRNKGSKAKNDTLFVGRLGSMINEE